MENEFKMEVDKVFIFSKSGLPRLYFDFNEDKLVVDQMLLSGLLSAIDGFSANLFKNESQTFMVDTGTNKITLFKGNDLTLAVISDENLSYLAQDFQDMLKSISQKYKFDDSSVLDPADFEDVKIKLIRILFPLPICRDWIPILDFNNNRTGEMISKYPILKELDGKKQFVEYPFFSLDKCEETYELFNYLYKIHVVKFSNMIEPKDYIIGTSKLFNLSSRPDEFKKISSELKNLDLVKLIKDLDEYTRIHDLIDKYGNNILDELNYLYSKNLIILIDEKFRRLLIIVDILSDFLKITRKIDKKGKIFDEINKYIQNSTEPEIKINIEINGKNFKLNKKGIFNTQTHQHLNNTEIIRKEKIWFDFLIHTVENSYKKYAKELSLEFFDRLTKHYLQHVHNSELEVLNPLLEKIESHSI